MARSKQKPKDEGPKGAPEWIVTFTDMISLLVTFFVLLMTFSSLEEYDLLKVESWLTGNSGLVRNRGLVAADLPQEDLVAATDIRRGAMHPHHRPSDKLNENLTEMGQRKRAEDLDLFLGDVADGLVIEFGEEECFEAGSTDVSSPLIKSLGEIGRVLEAYPHLVVVEGFTDTAFTPSTRFPTAEALSFARANACAEIMTRASRLAVERVQIVGRGDAEPRADNETFEGQRRNRRVQIRVLSLSKLRAAYEEDH